MAPVTIFDRETVLTWIELTQERLETRGVQSMRQISTRGSPSNSVDRKVSYISLNRRNLPERYRSELLSSSLPYETRVLGRIIQARSSYLLREAM